MKVTYIPDGGRFGYGFNYNCAECGEYVGNSSDNQLSHSATETKGKLFRRVEVPIACSQAGKKCELPKHEIEAREIAS
jgi:hypothetical protein